MTAVLPRPRATIGDAARFVALVSSGLLAGAVVAVWLVDVALGTPAALYVGYKQATTGVRTRTLPPLGGLAIGAVACFVAAFAVTVVFHFPLNDAILTWSAATPPADWQQVRGRWAAAHGLRTGLTVAGFLLLAVAARLRLR